MRIVALIVLGLLAATAGCGESVEHKLEQAKVALNSGRPDAALTYAQGVLKERPGDPVATLLSAKAHLRLRQYEESRRLLNELIKSEPSALEVRRELLNLALAEMTDLLGASEFTTNPVLDERFTNAKSLGHDQADWFGNTGKDVATAEFARARLVLLDSHRIERLLREEENRIRGAQGLVDPLAPVSSATIEEMRRQIKSMQLTVERHADGTLLADPAHFQAASMVVRLLKKREAWSDMWVFATKMMDRTDLPPALASELVGEVLNIPDRLYPIKTRLETCRKLMAAVSDQGKSSVQWKNVRARLHLRDGEKEQAMALAQELFRIQPNDAEHRLTYGWCLYESGQYSQAKAILQDLATDRRTHEQIQLLYGLTLAKLGEKTLAVEALRRVRDVNPGNQVAQVALVKLLSENRDNVTAITEDINKLYTANPADPEAIRFKLIAEIAAGNANNIRSLMAAVMKLSPRLPGHMQVLVDGHVQLKEFDKALEYASELQAADSQRLEPHLILARVRLLKGDLEGARRILVDAQGKFPESLNVSEALAQIYLSQGAHDRVIELSQALIKDKPEHINARLMLAHAYSELAMTEEAMDQINEIIQRHPNEPRALEMAAAVYRMAGQPELARAYIEKIDESSIDESKYPVVLAQLKLQKGEVAEAQAICDRAIASGSTDPRLRLTLASIHKITRNSGEEEIHLLAFVRDNPTNFQGYQSLARFYASNNVERGIMKFREMRDVNEVMARLAESSLLMSLGRSTEAVQVLSEPWPQMIQRRDAALWDYSRYLVSAMVQRDRSVDGAVALLDELAKQGILPARARLLQLELLWPQLDDKERVNRLSAIEPLLTTGDTLPINNVASRYAQAKQPEQGVALLVHWSKQRPKDATMRSLLGDLLLSIGRNDEAIAAYQEALALEPDVSGRYMKLAEVQIRTAQFPAAELTLDQVGKLDTGSLISSLWTKANLFIKLGLNEAAVQTLDELSKAGKANDPRVMLALGQVMITLNRFDEARATLLNIPSHADEYGAAQVFVARLERLNKATIENSRARLEKLAQDPGVSAVAAKELLQLANRSGDHEQLLEWADKAMDLPNLPPALRVRWILVRANIKARQRDWQAVDNAVSQLIAMDGNYLDYQVGKLLLHLTLKQQDQAKKLFLQNDKLITSPNGLLAGAALGFVKSAPTGTHPFIAYLIAMANGDFAAAESAAQTFPNVTPSLYRQDLIDEARRASAKSVAIEIYQQLAVAAVAQQIGLPELSDAVCLEIIQKEPQCVPAHAIRLASLTRQGTLGEAVIATIAKDVPESSLGLYATLSRHQTAKEWPQAIACAEKIVSREPDHDRAALHLVQIYGETKSYDKALVILERIYAKTGHVKVIAGNDMAYLIVDHYPDRMERAREIVLEVAKLNPASSTVLDTLGWIEHLSGNNKEALRHLSLAAAGNADSKDWHFHIGTTYAALGEKKWARRHLEAAKTGDGVIAEKAAAALAALDNPPNP